MTRILTIIALLFATPAWAEEVDGNSFYCEPMDIGTVTHEAFKFEGGKVFKYNESGQEFSYDYFAAHSNVTWEISDVLYYDIDRKTLQLKLRSTRWDSSAGWQCKFMEIDKARQLVKFQGELRELKKRRGNQF